MLCPVCGSDIPDGSLFCPYCDSELSVTRTRMRPLNRWCPICGALVSDDMEACPKCGSPLGDGIGAQEKGQATSAETDGAAPQADNGPAGDDEVADGSPSPMMDTAIPSPGEGPTSRRVTQLRTRALALAMAAALVVVGGTVLYITHPWNPGSSKADKETIDVDKSNAGSPGELSSISSQDGEASAQRLGTPGSRTTYEWECDAYAMILDCASRLETNQETLESVGSGELTGGLDAGADDCDSLVRQLDALASDLSSTTVDQAYEDDVEALERLVGWLREWAAALDGAWDGVAASPESERSAVVDEALSDAGATEAVDLYRASVAAAEPQDRG